MKCCAVCQESQTEHRQQPLLAHDVPSTPWTEVAGDMFQIKGDNYLLVTDYHSKFYLVEKMNSTTSTAIANKSGQWFSIFGPPLEMVTDNGPQYVGQPYEDTCSAWYIKHTTTLPRYPQSNGLIERQVRTVKGVIQKYAKTANDMLIALQQHQCTPLDSNLSSPADAYRPPSAPCGVGAGPSNWTALPTWQPLDGHAPPLTELVMRAADRRIWARDSRSLYSLQESPLGAKLQASSSVLAKSSSTNLFALR